MEKKAFLAIVLSFLVLFSWQILIKKVYHIDNKDLTTGIASQASKPEVPGPIISVPASSPTQTDYITLDKFENDKLRVEFINPGARIYRIFLKDYNLNSEITGAIYSKLFANKAYTLQKSNEKLKLAFKENGHYLWRTLNFHNNSYYIELETIYGNETNSNWTFNDRLVLNSVSHKSNPQESRLFEVAFLGPETKRKNPLGIKDKYVYSGTWNGLGFRDRYSCLILSAVEGWASNSPSHQPAAYIEKQDGSVEAGIELNNIVVPANSQVAYKSLLYCGPQDANFLKQNPSGFEEIIHYGTFDLISSALLSILHFFYKLSHNWGVALILLSLFTFFGLYPLTLKQMRSMKQMQELQPQIEALRTNYKDNPQRLNKEIMELYRRHKANPFGGCLPMILQIPVFFGLYQALSRSIVLKGAPFLWIKDLAEPDRLFTFSSALPLLGREINLLPILMAVAMFFQQKLSLKTSAATASAQEQQKMMAMIMPFMFGFIFYHFPSGLSLYWFLNTLLNTLSQWKILKTTTLIPASFSHRLIRLRRKNP